MENWFKVGVGVVTGTASYLLGGWSALLEVLFALIIFDYVTGMFASGIEGKLSSKVGTKGIMKKIMLLCLVAVAHFVDMSLGNAGNVVRDTTVGFFAANELLSIIENAGRAGIKLPPIFTKSVDVLRDKQDPSDKGGNA